MHTFLCCCTKSECPRLQEFNESFKRVECDALLAAEIGQVLLQEKNGGEFQYDLFKDNYDELKKLRWENEQSNEMIHFFKSEIKLMTLNSNELKKTIDNYEQEIQKMKLFERLLSLKTDIEDELKTQISDLKQELFQLRKSENNMITKHKRLNSNHETLQLTHEALLQEHDHLLKALNNNNKVIVPLIESNSMSVDNKCPVKNVIPEAIPNNTSRHHNRQVPQFKMSITNSNKNPFDVLHSVTQQTFDKINATDTRVLNRRLRRVFDMSELSDLSNSIISNILMDLSEFKNQFEWVHDYDQDPNTEYFFPLVLSIQDLLKELGTVKITLNDLQADYVKRIERLTSIQHVTSINYCQCKIEQQQEKEQEQETIIQHNKTFMQGLFSLFKL